MGSGLCPRPDNLRPDMHSLRRDIQVSDQTCRPRVELPRAGHPSSDWRGTAGMRSVCLVWNVWSEPVCHKGFHLC